MRKIWIIISIILCAAIAAYIFFPKTRLDSHCAFCDEAILQRQKIYEDDQVLALYTHKPAMPGHCLIIPKRHVERFEALSDDEALRITQVIKKVHIAAMKAFGASAYVLLQKNGRECCQTVPHVHFHYLPRKAGDDSRLPLIAKICTAGFFSPLSDEKMRSAVLEMKKAID